LTTRGKILKPSKKHLQILATIEKRGYYKPAYSDKEPATMTLLNKGIIEWREDYRGLHLTEYGKIFIKQLYTQT